MTSRDKVLPFALLLSLLVIGWLVLTRLTRADAALAEIGFASEFLYILCSAGLLRSIWEGK